MAESSGRGRGNCTWQEALLCAHLQEERLQVEVLVSVHKLGNAQLPLRHIAVGTPKLLAARLFMELHSQDYGGLATAPICHHDIFKVFNIAWRRLFDDLPSAPLVLPHLSTYVCRCEMRGEVMLRGADTVKRSRGKVARGSYHSAAPMKCGTVQGQPTRDQVRSLEALL